MRRLLVFCSFATLAISGSASGRAEREVPVTMMRESALTWVGPSEPRVAAKRDEVKIMSLSCRVCWDELFDILNGGEPGPSHLFLNTTNAVDFGLAWNWVATAAAQSGEAAQRAVAMELLAIFVDSPDVYLAQPELWRELCQARWSDDLPATERRRIWAEALNLLQRQNRLLGLLHRRTTPDGVDLADGAVPLPSVQSLSPDDQRMQIWENSEPALRPRWDALAQTASEARPVLHRVALDPGLALKASSWRKLREQLEGGGLFEWVDGQGLRHPGFRRWLAVMLSQPTLTERREWFDRTFAASEALASERRQAVSLLDGAVNALRTELSVPVGAQFERAADFEIWATQVSL